jgi:DNA-binding NarL/FixJ family response regulator
MQAHLHSTPDLALVGSVNGFAGLKTHAAAFDFDVLLIDLALPDLEPGFLETLLSTQGGPAVIAFVDNAAAAMSAQLAKQQLPWTISWSDSERSAMSTLRRAAAEVRASGSPRAGGVARSSPILERLTRREQEILELLARHFRDQEIAKYLGIGAQTVHSHMNRLFSKLGVTNRTSAVLEGLRLGLITLDNRPPDNAPLG